MTIPPSQYADDRNLRARQHLWRQQEPSFDVIGWVLGLAGLSGADRVLDVGCGNGGYLAALARRKVSAVGCDLSLGMLAAARPHRVVNADAVALPFPDGAFDVVLAPHMLYHVRDRLTAVRELRRTLAASGVCIAVTNGRAHLASLRGLVEAAMQDSTPEWRMPDPATAEFSMENGKAQLEVAFDSVGSVRPANAGRVVITDAGIAADYVASVADLYQGQVRRPWSDVVEDVRREVQRVIDRDGAFTTEGDVGAFVCR